jgi:hypothetical protein
MLLLPSKVIPRGAQWLYELKFDASGGWPSKTAGERASSGTRIFRYTLKKRLFFLFRAL